MQALITWRSSQRPTSILSDSIKHGAATAYRVLGDAALLLLMLIILAFFPLRAHAETPTTINMKVLVISADGTEPSFAAAQAVLSQVGVPYDSFIVTKAATTFSASTLSDGLGHGKYQGIMLATGNLAYLNASGNWASAFSDAQWQALWAYEATYRVRQVTLYTYPGGYPDTYGLVLQSGVDTTSSPLATTLTATGRTVFPYLNADNPVNITYAWTYLATAATATNPVTLLKTAAGNPIISIYTYPNGRQNMTITADGNPNLIHSLEIGYGVINWVTKGVFLGSRHVYLTPQPDDVFIDDDIWDPNVSRENGTYRITGADLTNLVTWQNNFQNNYATGGNLTLEMPFNGVGTTGIYPNDTLTPAAIALQGNFNWISHTYDHENLDSISYSAALTELRKNNTVANTTLLLDNYFKDSMIEPDISGLNNPQFLQAAHDFGIHYILSDTSQPGWSNPSPNAGFYSVYQPSILIIPRHPTNLYYNVSVPAEWVSEYNHFYAPGGLFATWDHALSYAEVLDKESSIMLTYLLKYDIDPIMFHQPNLRAYDGVHSLLGDLLEATITKYEALFTLNFRSPSQHRIGVLMAQRMAYNVSGASGTLNVLTIPSTITLATAKAATVPVTGVSYGTSKETYGGQAISNIALGANGTVTIPGPTW